MTSYSLLVQVPEEHLDLYTQNPYQASRGDAGYDLYFTEDQVLPAGQVSKISLGVKAKMIHTTQQEKTNTSFWLAPRSSIGKTPLLLKNSLGLIDSQYQGPLIVMVYNHDLVNDYTVKRGQSLFQIVSPILQTLHAVTVQTTPIFTEVSERGEGGFGSTSNQ
jgi:deoxyuridine 5'-triphosphate nucleotidohydrolase